MDLKYWIGYHLIDLASRIANASHCPVLGILVWANKCHFCRPVHINKEINPKPALSQSAVHISLSRVSGYCWMGGRYHIRRFGTQAMKFWADSSFGDLWTKNYFCGSNSWGKEQDISSRCSAFTGRRLSRKRLERCQMFIYPYERVYSNLPLEIFRYRSTLFDTCPSQLSRIKSR